MKEFPSSHVSYLKFNPVEHLKSDLDLAGYTEPGWYFWDEAETHCYGPFSNESKAIAELNEYSRHI